MKLSVITLVMLAMAMSPLIGAPARADEADKLPLVSGATEVPCGDTEGGACYESPFKRFEFVSPGKLGQVAKDLLQLSKKSGWKMRKVPGSSDTRYMSSNKKGFNLMWSIQKVKSNKGPDGKDQHTYHIYYWQIWGE